MKYTKKVQQEIENSPKVSMTEMYFCCSHAEYPDSPCCVDITEDGVWNYSEETARQSILGVLKQIKKFAYKYNDVLSVEDLGDHKIYRFNLFLYTKAMYYINVKKGVL